MSNIEDLHKRLIEVRKMSSELSLEHWLRAELNTWHWWLSVGLLIMPWIIWWKLVDRKRIFEILGYGLFIIMFATFSDVIGSELVLWNYTTRIFPIVPSLLPFDFTIAPVIFMSLYQYYTKWKSFLIAGIIISAVLAFIAEPLLVVLKLYKLISWKYIYSFPVYLSAAIISKWLVCKIKCHRDR
jgi:hypothetical protein